MDRLLQASFLILLFFSSSILLSQEDEQQDFSNERKLSVGMFFTNGLVNSEYGMQLLRGAGWEVSYRFRVFNIKGPFHLNGAWQGNSVGYPIEIDQKEYDFRSSIQTFPLKLRWGPEVNGSIEPFLQAGAYYAYADKGDNDIYISSEDGRLIERIDVDEFESFGHLVGLGCRYYNPNRRISVIATFEKMRDYDAVSSDHNIQFTRYLISVSFRYNIL